MYGVVHLHSKLSNATTGVKSFLLKVVQPFASHKDHGEGSIVSVHITGIYGHPLYAVQPIKK
jgi:hypothetical protein